MAFPQGRPTPRGGRPWVALPHAGLRVVACLVGLESCHVVGSVHFVPEKVVPSLDWFYAFAEGAFSCMIPCTW